MSSRCADRRAAARSSRPLSIAAVTIVATLGAGAGGARAQEDGPIEDNSFLIEEAYNQEAGVVQHIFTFTRFDDSADSASTFTQEWPFGGQRHQLSYTLAYLRLDGRDGWGDMALHYRYQLRGMDEDPIAVAPRLSLLLPTGEARDGLGAGSPGVQVNLPVSAPLGRRLVGHWNVGATFVPDAEARSGAESDSDAVQLGHSLIWLFRPRLNFLLEAVWTRAHNVADAGGTEREESSFVSPGVRFALDRPSGLQIVPGVAVPIGVGASAGEWALFAYLSFEHAL